MQKQKMIDLGEFTGLSQLGEGAFSKVYAAEHKQQGARVALKVLKSTLPSLSREIQANERLADCNYCVKYYGQTKLAGQGSVALIFEEMRCSLLDFIQDRLSLVGSRSGSRLRRLLSDEQLWYITTDLLKALYAIHNAGIIHRDVKPENILLYKTGRHSKWQAKIGDFGSCRVGELYDCYLQMFPPQQVPVFDDQSMCTDYVSTRWYRSPEFVMSLGRYGRGVDVWALGCVLFELLTGKPLFPGKDENDQMARIHNKCGLPAMVVYNSLLRDSTRFPSQPALCESSSGRFNDLQEYFDRYMPLDVHRDFVSLLLKMLAYDPRDRVSCGDCLHHPFVVGSPGPPPWLGKPGKRVSITPSTVDEKPSPVKCKSPRPRNAGGLRRW